ncbi:hypothetical protein M9H77_19279 [Catharanthus roseus]|uniref:Uncharacterized protein n=1 Tax=Catharanthus roseus TaxID=4058 RepID=A0ACC0B9W3_CATRO|nr:hypothetical protein M9H77_19279 [Catharanthus roseus]
MPPIYTGDDQDEEFTHSEPHFVENYGDNSKSPVPFLLWQPWRKALIIKVFRRNISYKLLVQRIKDIWKLDWDCEITDLEGYYLVRFRILLGRAVKVDPTTLSTSRGKFARIYVEVDFRQPLVPLTSVMGYLQVVEYEGLHQICFGYGEYRHRETGYSRVVRDVDAPPPVANPSPASMPVLEFSTGTSSESVPSNSMLADLCANDDKTTQVTGYSWAGGGIESYDGDSEATVGKREISPRMELGELVKPDGCLGKLGEE